VGGGNKEGGERGGGGEEGVEEETPVSFQSRNKKHQLAFILLSVMLGHREDGCLQTTVFTRT
jgi:hypothetical protein